GSGTGFLLKLASDASLVFATYLGKANTLGEAILVDPDEGVLIAGKGPAPGLPEPPPRSILPDFLIRLDAAASLVTSATYLQGTGVDYPSRGPSWLATDGQGSL